MYLVQVHMYEVHSTSYQEVHARTYVHMYYVPRTRYIVPRTLHRGPVCASLSKRLHCTSYEVLCTCVHRYYQGATTMYIFSTCTRSVVRVYLVRYLVLVLCTCNIRGTRYLYIVHSTRYIRGVHLCTYVDST